MSFQGLISGSECAAPSNPLAQVLKHTEGDRSLQQDRIGVSSSTRLHRLPGTSGSVAAEHDVALARQFFDGNAQGPSFASPGYLPPAEFALMGKVGGMGGPGFSEAWASKPQNHARGFEDPNKQDAWAAEFGTISGPSPSLSVHQNMPSQADHQQRPSYIASSGLYNSPAPLGMGVYAGPTLFQGMNANYVGVFDQKGKCKSREADFEAAFAQIAESLSPAQVETSRIEEVDSSVADIEESLRKATLETNEDPEVGTDFQKVWDHLQTSGIPPPKEDVAKWEAEFNQLMSAQREELDNDFASPMQKAWENGLGNFQESFGEGHMKFDNEGLPILGDYIFEANNKYLGLSNSSTSLLADAKALLDQNGSLSEAALLLEAAIQKGELGEGGYETWILLGETRNMDEREELGMRALTEGVKRAEAAGASGAGMLSLAISFTNESFDRASHTMLLRWLRARFPALHVPEDTIRALSTNSSWDTHTRITDLFLNAARAQNNDGVMDPDVQIGLGVLFYTNGEYDRAKDCFESALASRPKDYLLWNRLGSSLSNGSKPEEALGAYREALYLRPTYTRAIYNVGVACLNIGAHKEAAEHFLSALSLQDSMGDKSEQLWFTLRRAFLSLERPDLAEMAKPEARTNLEAFRKEGFEF